MSEIWSVDEGNIMYVPGRAAADQRGVGGRWGSRVVRSLLRPPHSPDTAPSGPPHTMRWAVQRIGRPSEGHPCIGLGHPTREQTSCCSGHPTQRTTMRGGGGCFSRPYPVSPSRASFSAMDCSRFCTVRSVLSSISICSVNRPAVLPSSSLARTLTLSVVAVSASCSSL